MYKFQSLKDHVYDYIADQILKGNLLPNEKINENKICQELNISRTPVREALIQLSSEDVLENVPRKGFMLRSLNSKEAAELYEVVGVLDGYAAVLACPNLTEKILKDMDFYINSMDLAITSENYEMYYKQQEIFHQLYLFECGNSTLIDTLVKLKNKFMTKHYDISKMEDAKSVLYETNNEHKEILRLFREQKTAELNTYIRDIHWEVAKSKTEVTI
ncbi:GntR family transcriptional regulator [Clostridium aminobutyricum]|uniref:GntR family transcriptional regulator n=1 Tax=Clostridium aminobutyricum TaxID=33953 RepID=A0A939D7M0_CLOAM|nr:GntR family transcriptional regulator [Clostridium aminobutyricum]MBN7772591.1 GntR family transcriptional regulator [Clostridium aminobutyricum]